MEFVLVEGAVQQFKEVERLMFSELMNAFSAHNRDIQIDIMILDRLTNRRIFANRPTNKACYLWFYFTFRLFVCHHEDQSSRTTERGLLSGRPEKTGAYTLLPGTPLQSARRSVAPSH